MTAFSTVGALFFTPFNASLWGSLNPATDAILREIAIDPAEMFLAVAVLLVVPALLGMWVARRWPTFAAGARRPFRILSLAVFALFVLLALAANWDYFLRYTGRVVIAVFLLNLLGLTIGYWAARAAKLPAADRRAVSIETGIQNSGLGLILIFNFFGGLGGMAITAAWWGIWHILSGLAVASWWRRHPPAVAGARA
jgi:BASS family bile acid:Na+ symporter